MLPGRTSAETLVVEPALRVRLLPTNTEVASVVDEYTAEALAEADATAPVRERELLSIEMLPDVMEPERWALLP